MNYINKLKIRLYILQYAKILIILIALVTLPIWIIPLSFIAGYIALYKIVCDEEYNTKEDINSFVYENKDKRLKKEWE